MTIAVRLSGKLSMRPPDGDPSSVEGDNGCQYGLAIPDELRTAELESSSMAGSVASPSSFVALAIDPNLRGRLLVIMPKPGAGPLDIRIVSLVSGSEDLSQTEGLVVICKTAADAITAVSIQGTGEFRWSLSGAAA